LGPHNPSQTSTRAISVSPSRTSTPFPKRNSGA
jgi:hypothetical protein